MEKIYSPKNALFLTSPLGFGEPGSFQFLGGMPILSRLVKEIDTINLVRKITCYNTWNTECCGRWFAI